MCLFRFSILCVVLFYCSVIVMFVFVVLGLVSSVLCQEVAGKNVSEMTCFVSSET